MQSYIRIVYESSADRGHRCPCSTVRDIRQYTSELIRKRHPELSNKKLLEATKNTIINAGHEFQEKYNDSTWKTGSVKIEKEKIKKFISTTLDRLMFTPESYATFKRNLAASSTPKKQDVPVESITPKKDIRKEVDSSIRKPINKKLISAMVQTRSSNADLYKTPDRKIKPKVASESKFFIGTIDYKDGEVIITSPKQEKKTTPLLVSKEFHTINHNLSTYHSALDSAESPFDLRINPYDDASTVNEEDLVGKELLCSPDNEDNFYDSIEMIFETPKLQTTSLPKRIKKLEQQFSELNSSLLASSIKHSQRKRADSLSSLHQLIDKMDPATPPIRRRCNSVKNSSPTQSPKTPIVAQHYLTPRICKERTKHMFDGKWKNLLETYKQGAMDIKNWYRDRESSSFMNQSINKLKIDSMFSRLPIEKTPYVIRHNEYIKHSDSLNLDCVMTQSWNSVDNKENIREKLLPKPDGFINCKPNKDDKGRKTDERMALKFKQMSRFQRINNKIEELSARIQEIKLNFVKSIC